MSRGQRSSKTSSSAQRGSLSEVPQVPEAEGALARAFIEPRNANLLKAARNIVTPSDFYDHGSGKVFEVICNLADSGKAIDKVSIVETLRNSGHLQEVGGAEAIQPDFEIFVDETRICELATSIREAARKRRLHSAFHKFEIATRNGVTSEEILAQAQAVLVAELEATTPTEAEAVDGATLLDDLAAYVRRYVVTSPAQLVAVALFVLHTYAFDAADFTPYLSINSPEKRCGKSRLLEVLDRLVRRPWLTGRTTAAALVRKIEAECPTLLLDESDTAFGADKEYADALRGALNSGHRRGGAAWLCVGKGSEIVPRSFAVFCPKAIAGIGQLPSTVEDRAIPIAMRRRAPSEKVERFAFREAERTAVGLRRAAAAWAKANLTALQEAKPVFPEELGDRAADCWEPLLAIAEIIGGQWPERARSAAIKLSTGEESEDSSLGVRLLRDVRAVFDEFGTDKLASKDLAEKLNRNEVAPWAEFSKGKPISTITLARLLKKYGIRPRQTWLDGNNFQGYERGQFEDAWSRYASHDPTTGP